MSEEKTESGSAPSGGGGGNKMVLILTAVNLVATLAIVGALVVSFKKENSHQKAEDIVAQDPHAKTAEGGEKKEGDHGAAPAAADKKIANFGKMVTLEQFTVNLSTPGSVNPKFVRVNISVDVQNDDGERELQARMPQVRNTIIDLFNSKRPSDISTPEGMGYIKEEIRNSLNSFMVNGKVMGVYFTNFAISS